MSAAADVLAALEANEEAPYGPVRTARAERLVELAEASGERWVLLRALSELVSAYCLGGDHVRIPVPFARLLRLWDDDPGAFSPADRHRLYWQFKWVTWSLLTHPDIPLARIGGWVDQMQARYREAGFSPRPVHQSRFRLAEHVGDLATAREAFEGWRTAPRDDLADCHACELRQHGDWLVEAEDDAAAVEVWQPVLDGQASCAEEPADTRAVALLPLVRLGRLDEARRYHLGTYRIARGNQARCWIVQRNLVFATRTGNEPRALEILAEHVDWLDTAVDSPLTHAYWLGASVNLLRRLEELGRGSVPVPAPRSSPGPTTTPAELRPVLEDRVRALAARFDARNGTASVSTRLETVMSAEPVTARLLLGVRSMPLLAARAGDDVSRDAAPGGASAGAPAGAGAATREAAAAEGPAAEGPAAEGPAAEGLSAADLLARAGALWDADGTEAEAVEVAIRAAHLADGVDDALAARARSLAGRACAYLDRVDEAVALLEQALPDLDRHADPPERVLVRRAYADCLCRLGEPADGARLLLEAAALAETWDDQTWHADLAHAAGGALDDAGRPADARRAYARAADLWRRLGVPEARVRAVRAQAWSAARSDPADWVGAADLFDTLHHELSARTRRPLRRLRAAGHGDGEHLPSEHAETARQHAVLLLRRLQFDDDVPDGTAGRALTLAEDAAARFTAAGDPVSAARAELLAAELEAEHLGARDRAVARLEALRERAAETGPEDLVAECDDWLEQYREVPEGSSSGT